MSEVIVVSATGGSGAEGRVGAGGTGDPTDRPHLEDGLDGGLDDGTDHDEEPMALEPGRRVSVEARMAGEATPHRLSVLLHEHVEHDFRPERLDDLLEKTSTFLEVTSEESGHERLLSKDRLLWLRVRAPQRELSADDLFETNRQIEVHLEGGSAIVGSVLYTVGDPEAPLAEFMNLQGQYFGVVEAGMIYFVHKKFVTFIEEVRS